MDTKYKIAIGVVGLTTAFAVGRYTVPERIKIEIKTVEVEKIVYKEKEDTNTKKHKKTVVTEITKPDGQKEKHTEITYDEDKEKKKQTDSTTDTDKTTDTVKEVVKGDSKVTISALGGFDFSSKSTVFGASVSKPVIGPITIGIWGLSNASCGASVGLTF